MVTDPVLFSQVQSPKRQTLSWDSHNSEDRDVIGQPGGAWLWDLLEEEVAQGQQEG